MFVGNEEYINDLVTKGDEYDITPDRYTPNGLVATISYIKRPDSIYTSQVLFLCDILITDDDDNLYSYSDKKFKARSTGRIYVGHNLKAKLLNINLFDLTKVLSASELADLYEQVNLMINEWVFDTLNNKN